MKKTFQYTEMGRHHPFSESKAQDTGSGKNVLSQWCINESATHSKPLAFDYLHFPMY